MSKLRVMIYGLIAIGLLAISGCATGTPTNQPSPIKHIRYVDIINSAGHRAEILEIEGGCFLRVFNDGMISISAERCK